MPPKKGKVFIALSGGIDSSTAAALLIEQGYDCSGVFMVTADRAKSSPADAKIIAKKLGIKLYTRDLRTEFENVLEYFTNEYKNGRTPNPCVYCNRHIKFASVLEFAKSKGADFFATGHYARIHKDSKGESGLYTAVDLQKDQSYALAMLDRKTLDQLIFPLGRYSKEQTRRLAAKFALEIQGRQESQEICFIPDDDYVAVLENRYPQIVRKGKIIDSSGKVLGEHNGTHRFTIGQRRGLKVAMGLPYYVIDIDAASNTVTLGPKQQTMSRTLRASRVNWLVDRPTSAFTAKISIRYNSKPVAGRLFPKEDNVLIEFESKVSAITPGQLAVFYVEDNFGNRVIGSGWIERCK